MSITKTKEAISQLVELLKFTTETLERRDAIARDQDAEVQELFSKIQEIYTDENNILDKLNKEEKSGAVPHQRSSAKKAKKEEGLGGEKIFRDESSDDDDEEQYHIPEKMKKSRVQFLTAMMTLRLNSQERFKETKKMLQDMKEKNEAMINNLLENLQRLKGDDTNVAHTAKKNATQL